MLELPTHRGPRVGEDEEAALEKPQLWEPTLGVEGLDGRRWEEMMPVSLSQAEDPKSHLPLAKSAAKVQVVIMIVMPQKQRRDEETVPELYFGVTHHGMRIQG